MGIQALEVPAVDIVIPVYNEERALSGSVRRLRCYLDTQVPFPVVLTIADNASTDATWDVAVGLAGEVSGVRAIHLKEKGRGRALRAAWSASASPVVAYMDVDLATNLDDFLPLVSPLLTDHCDVAIGSRLARGARVARGAKREVLSRIYNALIRGVVRNRFSDAQCGFKALTSAAARRLLPLVEDDGWFFDTELLILAEASGLRMNEVPVTWVDDPDSRVDVIATARGDLKGLIRMWRRLAGGGMPAGRARRAGVRVLLGPARIVALVAGYMLLFALHAPGGAFSVGAGVGVLTVGAVRSLISVARRDAAFRRVRAVAVSEPPSFELLPAS